MIARSRVGLAKTLRIIRLKRGFSQEALEPIVSRRYVSHLENGTKSPTLETLEAIAKHLGVHSATLVLGSELLAVPAAKRRKILEEINAELAAILADKK